MIGRRVEIKSKRHPNYGKGGFILRMETAKLLNKEGAIVKCDDGSECFVFDKKDVRFL